MDLSYWKTKAPGIKVRDTRKQFYSHFLWKLEVEAEGGRLITNSEDIVAALVRRRENAKLNLNHWYYARRDALLDRADAGHLVAIKAIKESYGDQIRVRVEEPNVQFYAEDEQTLKDIADRMDPKYLTDITGPKNDNEAQLLREGSIITRKPNEFGYKVFFRDKALDRETKQQIISYLENLGDTVRVTKGSLDMLSRGYPSMWGVYIFTQDPNVIVFLQLMDPGLISNIHKIVYLPL